MSTVTTGNLEKVQFFFEIGGEGTENGPPGGSVETLGKEYSALLISLEHRFYGESIPNGNVKTENLVYLTVEQALADLARFTDFYKSIEPEAGHVPWVVFGGSYPGALSSWYRTAYPDHSVGSLSSSGVVNCIVDYYDFDMQVSAATVNQCANQIRRVSQAFQNTIEISTTKENEVIKTREINQAGFEYSMKLFGCETDMLVDDFYYMIADSWSMAVQYSSKSDLCGFLEEKINNESTDEEVMTAFAEFTNEYWGADFCNSGFYNTRAMADPARWDVNARSWRYQTCAQVSYFNTAPASGSLRAPSVNLDYHLKQCAEIFGQEMFPSSADMNKRYGGEFPKATNVFYSDFSDDPWQRASVNFPVSATQPYFLSQCDDCGHCMDLHTPKENDPAPLQKSREEFIKYLDLWLSKY